VKIWKVILATIVIFAAGAFVGGTIVKVRTARSATVTPPKSPHPSALLQELFQARLKKELQLSADQTNRIDKIFAESNARIKILWGLVGPEMEKERQEVRESIRGILTPEQRETFEKLLKESQHRPDGRRNPRPNTNSMNSTNIKEK
jgi:hypothetical protein